MLIVWNVLRALTLLVGWNKNFQCAWQSEVGKVTKRSQFFNKCPYSKERHRNGIYAQQTQLVIASYQCWFELALALIGMGDLHQDDVRKRAFDLTTSWKLSDRVVIGVVMSRNRSGKELESDSEACRNASIFSRLHLIFSVWISLDQKVYLFLLWPSLRLCCY